jgi:DNA ligase-1
MEPKTSKISQSEKVFSNMNNENYKNWSNSWKSNYKKGEDGFYYLPTLYNIDKLGRTNYWTLKVYENEIHTLSRIDEGVIKQFQPNKTIAKNIGKICETTPFQQAILEGISKWKRKQDQGYSLSKKPGYKPPLPMLANKYVDRGEKYMKIPFAVSRKIDGIRMIYDDGKCYSRMGKEFPHLKHIKKDIKNILGSEKIVLDGELYSHDVPFNKLSGIVRQKNQTTDEHLVEYWIFDIIDKTLTYKERMKKLKQLAKTSTESIKFVFYEVVSDHNQVKPLHDKYVKEGFEGLMTRNLDSLYIEKNRSNDLLKYKDFEDDEFIITGFKLGKGTEENAIIFTCITKDGREFDVRPRGSIENRIEMGNNGSMYLGKKLTVRYQIDTRNLENPLPRFPVGIVIRDYE